jgi:tRNA threonylcarbamoyladenosine modification (KEOPS) complex Cgi121 subunit
VLYEIPELGQHVWISAFEAKIPDVTRILGDASRKYPSTCVQLVNLEKVAGSRFLFVTTYNALKSFSSKHRISRSLAMEILLYVAADRQIVEAIKLAGVTPETSRIAAIIAGPSPEEVEAATTLLTEAIKVTGTDKLLDEWSEARVQNVRSSFDIRDKELKAILRKGEDPAKGVERLAIERSALLAVRK